jgi:hypothetical protein
MIASGRRPLPEQKRRRIDSVDGAVGGHLPLSPAKDASVGIQSTALRISALTLSAFTLPGQRTIAGARIPPSKPDPKWPRWPV